MTTGFDGPILARAIIAIVLGLVLHSATLWAFRRLTA